MSLKWLVSNYQPPKGRVKNGAIIKPKLLPREPDFKGPFDPYKAPPKTYLLEYLESATRKTSRLVKAVKQESRSIVEPILYKHGIKR